MLDEYKLACKESADLIEGWETITKNDLCRLCVAYKNNQQLYNAYFSALLYRYWNLILKFHAQSYNVASPQDCYDWLVTALTYALEHTRWDDTDSTVYNDPNGPDKVINRCMKSVRLTFYQYINRKKRKDNFGMLSLEELKDNPNTDFDVQDEDTIIDNSDIDIKNYVRTIFYKKDYFLAYMVDSIVNGFVFDTIDDSKIVFNSKKLAKQLRQIDEQYCKTFANTYDIPEQEVISTLRYCNFGSSNLYSKIENTLLKLKHDPFILARIGDGNVN